MVNPLTHLGEMPVADFLRDYWQQKPLLIRNAFPDFVSPISGEELAGMALEEAVESRLVLEQGDEGPGSCATAPSPKRNSWRCRAPTGRCWCRRWTSGCRKWPC
ncbi:hypothetical protein [Microbulbifer taiwanensis]|uniref:Uncharacterized protein n=1 Tax=Microbulbifer taiwanensis TaxID=986746 RepID=A0ABW1YH07_9GAMM